MGTLGIILGTILVITGVIIIIIGDEVKEIVIGLILDVIGVIIFMVGINFEYNAPKTYEVKSAQTFYGSTEKINRVWLKDSDGSYFWIEIPDCDKPRFCEGKYIELSHNEFKNWIVSKELD